MNCFFRFFISHQHNTDVFMMVFFSLFCHSSVCLFTACAHDIEDIVCRYQVDYNAYADVMLYYMLFAINKKWIMNVVLWSKQLGWIHIGTWTISAFWYIHYKQAIVFFLPSVDFTAVLFDIKYFVSCETDEFGFRFGLFFSSSCACILIIDLSNACILMLWIWNIRIRQ